MKAIHIALLGSSLSFATQIASAQETKKCYQGFLYKIGTETYYAPDLPIVTEVIPYSPAQQAGIQVGDILESIDGMATKGLNTKQIDQLLQQDKRELLLSLRSVSGEKISTPLRKQCYPIGGTTERDLARAFSLYSPEDVQSMSLVYPFVFQRSKSKVWDQLHSYSFASHSSSESATLDLQLDSIIGVSLSSLGLRQGSSDTSDIIWQTYYSLSPLSEGAPTSSQSQTLRWSPDNKTAIPLPILSYDQKTEARYELRLELIAYSRDNAQRPIWSCKSYEYLSEPIGVKDYAQLTIPMMLRGFLMSSTDAATTFDCSALRYYYTGIIYSTEDLSYITDIENGSPAEQAGIRPGDRINKINGITLAGQTKETLLDGYRSFLIASRKYRDTSYPVLSRQEDINELGYPWQKDNYSAIAKLLGKDRYVPAFAYLFFYRPYVNDSGYSTLIFEIERDHQSYIVSITPQWRDESVYQIRLSQ